MFPSAYAYSPTVMRGAFVIRLGLETKTAEGQFEGWVEEVDSCTELRFRSTDELLRFLGERFDLAMASRRASEPRQSGSNRDEELA